MKPRRILQDFVDWIEHRMALLDIETRAALADTADVDAESLAELWAVRHLGPLQQSERRRLAWALQVSLKRMFLLDEGEIDWIEDDDRYIVGAPMRFTPAFVADDDADPRLRSLLADRDHPLGTPLLGRILESGKVDQDECWDQEFGRRLPDGQPMLRDVYALQTTEEGNYVVLRNVGPAEAKPGLTLAVFLWDGFDGRGLFGELARDSHGLFKLIPRHSPAPCAPGAGERVEPDQIARVGRLVRRFRTGAAAT